MGASGRAYVRHGIPENAIPQNHILALGREQIRPETPSGQREDSPERNVDVHTAPETGSFLFIALELDFRLRSTPA